eukprot:7454531-Pyramimonas_sp.AAC.2
MDEPLTVEKAVFSYSQADVIQLPAANFSAFPPREGSACRTPVRMGTHPVFSDYYRRPLLRARTV